MRIDLPSFGEYKIQRPAKPTPHAANRHAATPLVLPRIDQAVPREYAQQGDLTTIGFLGQWLIETGNLPETQWNPEKPIQSITAAFDATVNKALSGKHDINIGVAYFRPESDNIYLPECFEGESLEGQVILAVESDYSRVLEVPYLQRLWEKNPRIGNRLLGLIDMGFDDNIRCFGSAMAWYTATYAYYMGEVELTKKSKKEDDATIQEWKESGEISEDTPLPSELMKILPKGDFFDPVKQIAGLKAALADRPGAYEKAILLQRSLVAQQARKSKIDAWSICGTYNYDSSPYFALSIAGGDDDKMLAMFDIFMNDQMQAGTSTDMKGLAQLNSAADFSEWLESLTMGCKLAEQALDLIESLQQ